MPSRPAHRSNTPSVRSRMVAVASIGVMSLAGGALSGCQTTIGGQTLPSAYYLQDDVQFFPAGPEFLLPNQKRALDEYRAQQAGFDADLQSVGQ